MIFKKIRGQSTIEYATMVIVILAALLTVGVYFKRGVQGRWKAAVDDMGDQYDPKLANSDITHRLVGTSQTQVVTYPAPNNGIWTMRYDYSNTVDTRTGNMVVGSF